MHLKNSERQRAARYPEGGRTEIDAIAIAEEDKVASCSAFLSL
jgi:hypothetical protein